MKTGCGNVDADSVGDGLTLSGDWWGSDAPVNTSEGERRSTKCSLYQLNREHMAMSSSGCFNYSKTQHQIDIVT